MPDTFLVHVACILGLLQPISCVKIGVICETNETSWQAFYRIAGAFNIARDRLIEEGVINRTTIER